MPVSVSDRALTRRQIEWMILKGQSIIIVDQKVLRVDAWIPYHPGGHKTIEHMVGKDATDEISVSVFYLLHKGIKRTC